jgi:heme o synthase
VLSILPIPFRMSGGFYLITALALDAGLIIAAIRLLQDPSNAQARSTYKYTTLYLTLLFLVMMIDQFVRLPIR